MVDGLDLARRWPRFLSLALGLWLVVSAVAMPRVASSAAFDRLMVGIFVAANAVMAIWASWFRFANLALGAWLLLGALMFDHATAFLLFSTLAVAAAVGVLSLVPSPARLVDPRRPAVTN